MEHNNSESTKTNYNLLKSRIISINDKRYSKVDNISNILDFIKSPTLIMATGGSKVVGLYLDLILQSKGIICEVIEPRDFVYKKNLHSYSNLIVISSSGKSNGIEFALDNFNGNKYLISQNDW